MSQTTMVLLQVAGYLRLIEKGFPPSRNEAIELQEKIAAVLSPPDVALVKTADCGCGPKGPCARHITCESNL